ncbi:hypothetical protein F2Q69_00044698 [Brassica cretica]|uniref:Uncharacterized protein n=1 Tax=Brassica cretica TaxID=69181 RepID=A0A8S9NMN0_BRACR|nr:hypothetical protein F2Q69_00044698 [Brassica cretica]
MDIELVVINICRRRPCFRFSDPLLPVSIFTVVATTTACHHTEELDDGGDNKTVVWLEDVGALVKKVDMADELDGGGDNKTVVWLEDVGAPVVMRLRWRRKKTIMTSRLS